MYDAIIIGAGPAGITAGIYLVRAGKKVLLLEKGAPGGKVFLTHEIENYPGFDYIEGPKLADLLIEQAKKAGVEFNTGFIQEVEKINDKFIIKAGANEYESANIIIATGTKNKLLNVPGEVELQGMGVSYCAICDGNFFRNKKVAVIGGGNSAIEEALYLAAICEHVTVVYRSNIKAEKVTVERLKATENVTIIGPAETKAIIGENRVEQIEIEVDGQTQKIDANGVFIYVGIEPITEPFKNLNITDPKTGAILVDDNMETTVPGVYAAGDVIHKNLRQIVTATNDGAIAAQAIISKG